MNFLVNGWNVNDSWNSIQITCLVIFFVLFIFSLFLFISLIIYKNILKNLVISLKEAEKIARNSLQSRLKRIDDIVNKNPNNAKKHALQIWQAEYKILIENKFLEQLNFIQRSFVISKMTYPKLKNLRQTKKCLDELKLISQKIYLIYRQTDKLMAWELIQRDTRIKVRELFNDLKQEIDDVNENKNFNFNRIKMLEKKQAIDKALTAINLKIIEGNNLVAEVYQEKTNEQIFVLIQLLDLFYNSEKLLNNVLPDKIKKVEVKIRTLTLDQVELKKNLNKISTLKETFSLYKNQIFESLYLLDYDSTFQKLSYISELVSNFETDIQYEEKIKVFMNEHLIFLNQIFEGLKKDLENVKNSIIYNQEIGKPVNEINSRFLELQKLYITLNREWNDFYNFWSNVSLYQKDSNFLNIENNLIKLLQELKIIYQELIDISKNLKTKNNLKEEIETKIFEVRAILSTSEVGIIKNTKIIDCEKQKKIINELYSKIDQIEREIDTNKNHLDLQVVDVIIEKLDEIIEQAFDLKNEIKNKVLLAILAENIIIYLDRYLNNENVISNFDTVLEHYENSEWNEVLNLGIYSLQTYKK